MAPFCACQTNWKQLQAGKEWRELLRLKESDLLNDIECKVATVKINETYLFISSLDF